MMHRPSNSSGGSSGSSGGSGRRRSRRDIGIGHGNDGRLAILCAAATTTCLLAAPRRTMMSPPVACAYLSPLPTTMHHHQFKMAGIVPHRSQSVLARVSSTRRSNRHHHPLLMTFDEHFDESTTTTTNSADAATVTPIPMSISPTSEITSFDDDISLSSSTSARLDTSFARNNAKNDAIFDNLLPSTRAFTSPKSNNRRRDNNAIAPKILGPSSSAMFPASSELAASSSSTTFSNESNSANPITTTTWKERLVNVSNIASFLCILDCTLLPLFSVVMPALSWGAGVVGGNVIGAGAAAGAGSGMMNAIWTYLPTLSHGIALYFVIPMGIVTSIINYYYGHGEWKFSIFSLVGLVLIFITNSNVMGLVGGSLGIEVAHLHHHHAHDACGAMVGAATSMMAHTCPPIVGGGAEGLVHRLTNTMGCVFLLGSNYAGKKYMEKAKKSSSSARGCAASAFSDAWGGGDKSGEDGRVAGAVFVCGCSDCGPSYGAGSALGASSNRREGENFFQWKQSSGRRR